MFYKIVILHRLSSHLQAQREVATSHLAWRYTIYCLQRCSLRAQCILRDTAFRRIFCRTRLGPNHPKRGPATCSFKCHWAGLRPLHHHPAYMGHLGTSALDSNKNKSQPRLLNWGVVSIYQVPTVSGTTKQRAVLAWLQCLRLVTVSRRRTRTTN